MVTGVSSTDQAAYLSITNNTQKTGAQSETENTSSNDIEDSYVPSFDIKGTGSEFYENISKKTGYMGVFENGGQCLFGVSGPDSLDSFKNYIKEMAIQDYNKQNPNSDLSFFNQNNMPDSMKKYLDSVDYEKEYGEYKQSRGCSTDEDLKIVSASPFQTKDQLIGHASMLALSSVKTMQDKGFTSRSFDGVNFNDLLKNLDLKDVNNFANSYNSAENYQQCVLTFQSFCNLISKQENISGEIRNLFAGYSEDIDNSKEGIKKFSDEIEEDNKRTEMQQKYNASLISKYAS